MSKKRKTPSGIWNYFTKIDDAKAECDTCKKVASHKTTITNLKSHLKRKHIEQFAELISKERSNIKKKKRFEEIRVICQGDDSEDYVAASSICEQNLTPASNPSSPDTAASSICVVNPNCATNPSSSARPSRSAVNFTTASSKNARVLTSCVIKEISPDQKSQIDRDLLYLFIKDFQPFSIVEDAGFSKLMQWIPGYKLPGKKTISETMIPELYHQHISLLKDVVFSEVESVCITADCWTSSTSESYISITGHYIDADFNFKSVLLKCTGLQASHTSIHVANEITDILQEWKLYNKVNFAVSDNAVSDNIATAFTEVLKFDHFECYARTLHLIVEHSLQPMQPTIDKVKKIVLHFQKSSVLFDKLLMYQVSNGSDEPKCLIEDVPTLWNSTYLMLKRFVELEEAITATMAVLDKDLPIITAEECLSCKELCQVLQPFVEMTHSMSDQKYVTGSSVIVISRCLKGSCDRLLEEIYTSAVRLVLESLNDGLDTHFSNIENNSTFALCTFLDPRYKIHVFQDSSSISNIKKIIKGLIIKLMESELETTNSLPVSESPSKYAGAWEILNKMIANVRPQTVPTAKAIKEMDTYLEDDVLPRLDEQNKVNCPLTWWKKHQHTYPHLSKLFKMKCNIVATSIPCERLFSNTGLSINDRRLHLSSTSVKMLMFLNANVIE